MDSSSKGTESFSSKIFFTWFLEIFANRNNDKNNTITPNIANKIVTNSINFIILFTVFR